MIDRKHITLVLIVALAMSFGALARTVTHTVSAGEEPSQPRRNARSVPEGGSVAEEPTEPAVTIEPEEQTEPRPDTVAVRALTDKFGVPEVYDRMHGPLPTRPLAAPRSVANTWRAYRGAARLREDASSAYKRFRSLHRATPSQLALGQFSVFAYASDSAFEVIVGRENQGGAGDVRLVSAEGSLGESQPRSERRWELRRAAYSTLGVQLAARGRNADDSCAFLVKEGKAYLFSWGEQPTIDNILAEMDRLRASTYSEVVAILAG